MQFSVLRILTKLHSDHRLHDSFIRPEKNPESINSRFPCPLPQALATTIYFLSLWSFRRFCGLWTFYIKGIMYYVAFSACLLALVIRLSCFIQGYYFLWPNNTSLCGFTTFHSPVHQVMDIWVVPLLSYLE